MFTIKELARVLLHLAMFGFSFYALSGLDVSKIMLNTPQKSAKAQTLLILASLALGYLGAQFILALTYNLGS
jgi:uncharacterized membrane protein YwzB